MRTISSAAVTDAVARLCVRANTQLPPDIAAALARSRGQSLAQMALAWVLKDPVVTTALIGASRPSQIRDCLKALDSAPFTPEELSLIDADADR